MKRVLALLSLVCALFVVSACHYDVNLSVQASADLFYPGRDNPYHISASEPYGGFHRNSLSDNDLERIFTELINPVRDKDFQTAMLYLSIYDEIGSKYLRDEVYGVVYNSGTGRYDFAEMGDML